MNKRAANSTQLPLSHSLSLSLSLSPAAAASPVRRTPAATAVVACCSRLLSFHFSMTMPTGTRKEGGKGGRGSLLRAPLEWSGRLTANIKGCERPLSLSLALLKVF